MDRNLGDFKEIVNKNNEKQKESYSEHAFSTFGI